MRQKVITGSWNGEEIWRWETPEEMLAREGIPQEAASLYIGLDSASVNLEVSE